MSHESNISRIEQVASALGDLRNEVVFVGGATVSMYAEFQAYEVRATDDVDIIIEAVSYRQHGEIEERLRARGFVDDIMSGIRGRYKVDGITVDVMPTTDLNMGFSNKWYPDGYQNAIEHKEKDGLTIKILSAPYFIATKFEAFKNRGYNDPRQSHDFEDIIYVFENRPTIWEEIRQSSPQVKGYLRLEFGKLMDSTNIYEWIDCHVRFYSPPSTDMIIEELEKLLAGD